MRVPPEGPEIFLVTERCRQDAASPGACPPAARSPDQGAALPFIYLTGTAAVILPLTCYALAGRPADHTRA